MAKPPGRCGKIAFTDKNGPNRPQKTPGNPCASRTETDSPARQKETFRYKEDAKKKN